MSGREVPRATSVMPMNHGFRPAASDSPMAPWTRNWAPITDHKMPNTSHLSPARTTTLRPKIQPVNSSPISMSSIRASISSRGPVRCEIARFRMYGTKRAMRATPSYCVRLPSSNIVAATTVTIARNTASRRTISFEVLIGRTRALAPITNAGGASRLRISGHEFAESAGVRRATDLHRNAPSGAHRAAPQRVAIRMAHRHVDVRAAADPRRDIVDPEVQVLVHGRLERERANDPRRKVLLGRADVSLPDFEDIVQTRLAQGRGVVPHDDVLGDALCLVQGQLLVRRQPHVPVKGSLEPPIDAEQFEFLRVVLDRRVEEVEVEDGAG